MLSIVAFKEIMRILKRAGVRGAVSVKSIIEEKKKKFGCLVDTKDLMIVSDSHTQRTTLGICNNIPSLINILYNPLYKPDVGDTNDCNPSVLNQIWN